jgi:HAD superfamily hydrolase (TIGR01484 family)
MRYHVLAADYDGTLAHDGTVSAETLASLRRLVESGRRLILVTGRRLAPLREIFPELGLFERIVVENGAVVYDPATDQQVLLAEPPSPEFAAKLQDRGVHRVEFGEVIVATWRPNEHVVLEAIRELGLELQIIFNKDAVMVLPSGINKAVGLRAALDALGLSPLNTVAVGDAENDLAMLHQCGLSAAVSNALDSVKAVADVVLSTPRGAGVQELIERLLENDLADVGRTRTGVLKIGTRAQGEPLVVPLHADSLLVSGGPGGGKSLFGLGFLEQLTAGGGQACILDPEGDYVGLESAVVLGTAERAPEIEEVVGVLEQPHKHAVVSCFSLPKDERAEYFHSLLLALRDLRAWSGRPHWIVVDEAHYALPRGRDDLTAAVQEWHGGLLLISAYHDRIAPAVVAAMQWIICISQDVAESVSVCQQAMGCFTSTVPEPLPAAKSGHVPKRQALLWRRNEPTPRWFEPVVPRAENQRHQHSYYDGDLEPQQRFVFRGPHGKLNLEVQNVRIFLQIAEGLDEETWEYHRRRNDYSRWFESVIQDVDIAEQLSAIENNCQLSPVTSRLRALERIRERFEPVA